MKSDCHDSKVKNFPAADFIKDIFKFLMFPGKSLAVKMDKSFASFLEKMEKEIKSGDRQLLFHKYFILAEYIVMFATGFFLGYYSYATRIIIVLLLLLPILALIDTCASKRIYRKLSWSLKYLTSLLWCSDMIYYFVIGSLIATLIRG